MIEFESYDNVWDAIADTPEEAANLTARSDIMDKLVDNHQSGRLDPGRSRQALPCHAAAHERLDARADFEISRWTRWSTSPPRWGRKFMSS